ncbi:hypothetical protein QBC45DRAFT_331535, partial [Copromyces sp. CBS 386.78]
SLRTTFINRVNKRFINVFIYFFQYKFKIYYILNKFNFLPDIFNRLKVKGDYSNPEGEIIINNV